MDLDLEFTPFEDSQCWWEGMNIREFLLRARLPRDLTSAFTTFHQPMNPISMLIPLMKQFLLKMLEEISPRPDLHGLLSHIAEDRLIHGFLEMVLLSKTTTELTGAEKKAYCSPVITKLFGYPPHLPFDSVLAEEAFCTIERTKDAARSPSATLVANIKEQSREYWNNEDLYLAPFTCLVGPSGIGKSFLVKQLAEKHGMPVFYINLQLSATGFPLKSSLLPPASELDTRTLEEH